MFDESGYDNNIVIDKGKTLFKYPMIEFINAHYCTIYELSAILREKQTKLYKSSSNMNYNFNLNLQYAERFNKYGTNDELTKMASKAMAIRDLMGDAGLSPTEESLIINLLPLDAEEAFSLIPTLKDK